MALFDPSDPRLGPVPSQPQPTLPAPPPAGGPAFAAGDPGYQAALAAQLQANAQNDAALKAAREQLLIQFGDPNLASQFQNLDPAIQSLIQANSGSGNSILSRLQQTHQDNRSSILNQLAAHGLLKSGDLGYRQMREGQDYGHSVYDAQQNVLGSLNSQLQSYLQQKAGSQGNVDSALQSAYQNYISNPYKYTGQTQLPPVPHPQAPAPPSLSAPKIAPSAGIASRPGGLSSNPTQGVYSVH